MKHFPLLLALAVLAGCSEGFDKSDGSTGTHALYAPSEGELPVPNDLLYAGTLDATLNLPVANPGDYSDPQVALNALDGWSPSVPFVIDFSRPVDVATFVPGGSIRIFEVTTLATPTAPVGGPVTGVTAEVLAFSVITAAEVTDGSRVRVLLQQPLKPATTYMVLLTDALLDDRGRALAPPEEWLLLAEATFEPGTSQELVGQLLNAMLAAAGTQGIAREDVVLSYTFTTQGTTDVLGTTWAISKGQEAGVIAALCAQLPFGCADQTVNPFSLASLAVDAAVAGSTIDFLGAGPDAALVYTGGLTLPYYLTAASNPTVNSAVSDPAPLTGFWRARYELFPGDPERNLTRFNPLPLALSAETIPVLISLPRGIPPAGGWPVVVYMHGITRQRSDMLAIADALALGGLACVAIDDPLHGLSEMPANPLFAPLFSGYQDGTRRERTFGIDFLDNATGAPGPDGVPDPSGIHYINLQSLLTGRDNLRQAVTDVFALMTVLGDVDVRKNTDGTNGADGVPDFDLARIHLVGHSLGGMLGTIALAYEPAFVSSTLAMSGTCIVEILNASASFGPVIQAGLAAAGILPGTPEYAAFLFAAQTVVESGDPVAFAPVVALDGRPIHLMEVVGGGPGGGLPDQTIPNSVADAPLAGTEPMIALLGLASANTTVNDPLGVRAAVRFIEGTHGSIISPGATPAELAAFLEMQSQVATFAATSGQLLQITDTAVVQ